MGNLNTIVARVAAEMAGAPFADTTNRVQWAKDLLTAALEADVYENGTNIGNEPRCCDCESYELELSRCNEKRKKHERTLVVMTEWLEKNQPDVFRRGLWDAIGHNMIPNHLLPKED